MENWRTERFEDSGKAPIFPIHRTFPKLADPRPVFRGGKESSVSYQYSRKGRKLLNVQ